MRSSLVASHGVTVNECSAAWGGPELAFMTYWEWFKLIVTAFLISSSMTASAFALWWFVR
jgi:hypothetical protein